MVGRETLEAMAREFAAEMPLAAEDWEAVLVQVPRVLEAVAALDELPLDGIEPAAIYKIVP